MKDDTSISSLCTRTAAFSLCVVQFVAFLFLCYKNSYPEVLLYETTVRNMTLHQKNFVLTDVENIPDLPFSKIISLNTITVVQQNSRVFFLFGSILTVGYALATTALLNESEDNIIMQEYTMETMHELLPWDLFFWILFIILHYNLYSLVSTPVHIHTCILICLMSFVSIYMASLPKNPEQRFQFQSNIFFLIYFISLYFLLGSNQNLDHDYVGISIFSLICLDFLLIFGHSWDVNINMETIVNCRLTYVCLSSILNLFTFYTWPMQHNTI